MSWTLALNSLCLCALSAALAWAAGSAAAVWAAGGSQSARASLRTAAALCLALPPFVPANAWLDVTASWRAWESPERVAFFSLPLAAFTLGGLYWPLVYFPSTAALQNVGAAGFESEPDLCGWAALRWVAWPALRGASALGVAATLALAVANFTVPTLFQVRVFTEEFWVRFNTDLDPIAALRAAWPMALAPLALWAWLRKRPPNWIESDAAAPAVAALWRQRLGAWRHGLGVPLAVFLIVCLGLPLARLAGTSRTWRELPPAAAAGHSAISNAFALAVAPATGAVLLGAFLAGTPRRPRGPGPFWLMLFLPGVLLGAACIQLFHGPGFRPFYVSLALPATALTLRILPLAWACSAAGMARADPVPEEWLRTAGAGRWEAAWLGRWPQTAGAVMAGWLGAFLLCLWDVETIVLIQPPGGETVGLRIFNLLHYGHAAQVNALCVVALGLGVTAAAAAVLVTRWARPGSFRRRAAGGIATAVALAAAGCQPDTPATRAPIDARTFSEAQVFGERGAGPGQFNKPRSLALDREDNLFVVDITGRVQKFDRAGRWLTQWRMPETDIGKPKGMGLDPAGHVIVVEPHYQRINHFDGDGRLVAQWGAKGTNIGEFILPRSIAVDSHGEYLVTDYSLVDRVQRVAADLSTVTGTNPPRARWRTTASWGEPGLGPGQFNRAEGVAVDAEDRVYVADSCNHRIQVFDLGGNFLLQFGHAGSGPGALSYPYDIRVDRTGRVIVCEFGNSRLSVFDRAGKFIETVGRAGSRPGEFANPWAIDLDSHGNLYVADSQNHRVQRLRRRGPYPAGPRLTAGGS